MKSDEILLLLKAGYTRQEIEAMDQAEPAACPPAVDPPAVDPPAVDPPAADPSPASPPSVVNPTPAPAPAFDGSAILKAIDGLGAKITAAMQAASLSAAMMRAPAENESVEQVIASIINPKE